MKPPYEPLFTGPTIPDQIDTLSRKIREGRAQMTLLWVSLGVLFLLLLASMYSQYQMQNVLVDMMLDDIKNGR